MKPIRKDELKVVFMGTGGPISTAALNSIINLGVQVVGVIDNYMKRDRITLYDRFSNNKSLTKKVAKENNIPFLGTDNVNSKETEEWIIDKKCNLICVCSAHQLMKENIINIPKYGAINAHGGLLPNYRGPNPPYWCFRNMEKCGGATLHFINLGEDTGDIIVQRKYEIPFGSTMEEYNQGQIKCVGECYTEGLQLLIEGKIKPVVQSEPMVSRARNVKREDYMIDYENWDVKNAYHFLNGTGGISQIYAEGLYSYTITGYKVTTDSVANGKYDIQCKNGYVMVRRKLISPVRFAKNIVKGVLIRI